MFFKAIYQENKNLENLFQSIRSYSIIFLIHTCFYELKKTCILFVKNLIHCK